LSWVGLVDGFYGSDTNSVKELKQDRVHKD